MKDKLIIAKDMLGYYVTPESNYNARIRNERKVTRLQWAENPQDVIDYYVQYFGSKPDDFEIVCLN